MTTVGIATGAGRGMGLACAERLAEAVDVLLAVDLDQATLSIAAAQISAAGRASVEAFPLDVSDVEGIARLASRVGELGTLRAVAHAAGISPTMGDWRRILTVDLVGTALLVEALRPLATTGTAMVCFASMAPWMAFPEGADPAADAALDAPLAEGLVDRLRQAVGPSLEASGSAYGWAKRGVQRLVRHEAVRLGPLGARICAVSPGLIDTPQGAQEAQVHTIIDEMVRKTPLGRWGHAADVAAVVAFLCSDEARFVTGIDILVDGGVYAAMEGAGSDGL